MDDNQLCYAYPTAQQWCADNPGRRLSTAQLRMTCHCRSNIPPPPHPDPRWTAMRWHLWRADVGMWRRSGGV
eukprot:2189519-Rhodomonas_salina.1